MKNLIEKYLGRLRRHVAYMVAPLLPSRWVLPLAGIPGMAGGANMTVTTLAAAIGELWTPELNRAVMWDLTIAPLFEDKTAWLKSGDTAHLPSRHNLTANTKAAGTAATPEAITENEQTFVVNTQKVVAFEIEDIAEIQSNYDMRSEYTQSATYALKKAWDTDAGVLFDDNTTNDVGTLGSELADDDLIKANQLLDEQGAPDTRYMAVPPATHSGFLKLDKFVNSLYTGDNAGAAVHRAQVGMLYNSTVYKSNHCVGSSPSANGSMWGKGHFIKIVQRAPAVHVWYSPLDVAWVVTMDTIYGMYERQEAIETAAGTTNSRLWSCRLRCVKNV